MKRANLDTALSLIQKYDQLEGMPENIQAKSTGLSVNFHGTNFAYVGHVEIKDENMQAAIQELALQELDRQLTKLTQDLQELGVEV